jgi:hypothetical protein
MLDVWDGGFVPELMSVPSEMALQGASCAHLSTDSTGGSVCLHDCRTIVHPLLFCPPLQAGTRFFLVHRTDKGERRILHVGHTTSPHPTLNLATIRFTSARLGANEVHVMPAHECVITYHG